MAKNCHYFGFNLANLIFDVRIARMYARELITEIVANLAEYPAVAIVGPRQVGKTTLAHEIAKNQESAYLDLENPADMEKLRDPVEYLNLHADKLVILDEIQRYPDLFMPLRGVIDKRRQEGRGNGRFLILGSASNKLMQQSSESLAGRIHYAELAGLNPMEIEEPNGEPLRKLWQRGGFPNSYTASNDNVSYKWRNDFIRTYLERDIHQLGTPIPAETLRRLWTMLAHRQGEQLNAADIAASLGIASVTVKRYIDLMVDLLLVRKLQPLHVNIKKRLVKSPRVYVRDSGITHALLQIQNYENLLGHPIHGKSWEGFVIETIMTNLPIGTNAFFYRTSAGAEIDLVIEFGVGKYWAIEIKASSVPKMKKGFYTACEDLKVENKFVIYTGTDKFPSNENVMALSLSDFITELRNI